MSIEKLAGVCIEIALNLQINLTITIIFIILSLSKCKQAIASIHLGILFFLTDFVVFQYTQLEILFKTFLNILFF